MEKINFSNGEKISAAKVTINNVDYEVTPAVYDGATPLNATVFNNMQENIEDAIDTKANTSDVYTKQEVNNLIPTKAHQINVGEDTDYRVNLLKTKNLFNVNNSKIGVLISDQGVESSNSNWNLVNDYIEVKPNSQITISCQTEQTPQFKVYEYNSSFGWVQRQDYNSGLSNTFTLSATTKYIRIGYRNDRAITNIQVEEGSTATEYTPFIPNQINVDNEKYSDTINVGATEDSRSRVNVLHSDNLINPQLATTTQNGVTCTNNGDGTYTLNGTATDTCQFNIITNLNLTEEYKLSGCPAGGSAQTYYMFARNSAWSKVIGDTGEGKIGTFDSTVAVVCIAIQNGITCNNLVFKPMITKDLSTTYADFEPYIVPSIKVDNEMLVSKNVYSTNEVTIGEWLGKPLYRKVILSTISSGTTSTEINLGIANISQVYRAEVRFNSVGSGDYVFNSYYNSASDYMRFFMRNNVLQIRLGANTSGFNIVAIVEYTKTTD